MITVIAACLLILFAFAFVRECLVISDQDSGKVYLSLPVKDGEEFTITYKHSVHQTPVSETYQVRGGEIYVIKAVFYNFGAGMQTDYPPGCTWHYADDGAIVVEGYDIPCPELSYCVSEYYDHTLEYRGMIISLGEACGKGSVVDINIRKRINVDI